MNDTKEELPVLIAQTGPLEGQRWTIDVELTIGRSPDCAVVLTTPDKQVSRVHARVTLENGEIYIQDQDSKNGTHVNGKRIQEKTKLVDGNTVQIAMAQQFVFLSSDATVPLELGDISPIGLAANMLLRLDKRARRVWVDEKELEPPLSVAQFTMMELLYEAGGRVVTRQELVEAIWGEENAYDVSNQALDALVRRLRDRLNENHPHEFIVTVRGHGLRIDNPKLD
jgi:hypothetical protein